MEKTQKFKKYQLTPSHSSEDSFHSDVDEEAKQEAPLPQPTDFLNEMSRRAKMKHLEDTGNLLEIIHLTKDEDSQVRLKAIQCLCPCKVLRDFDIAYERLFELATDPDPKIRYQVLHNICDGSPKHYEDKVVQALNIFNKDKDKKIRRAANRVLGSVLRRGKWNIL